MKIKKIPPHVHPYAPIIPSVLFYANQRVAGEYYGPLGASATSSGVNVTAGYIFALPFIVLKRESFDRIAINITTAAVGTARLGIYSDNGSCAPSALLVDVEMPDTNSTGVKEITINQALEPGLYWLAITVSATIGIRAGSGINLLGLPGVAGDGNANICRVTKAYATLPDPFPASVKTNDAFYGVSLRRA